MINWLTEKANNLPLNMRLAIPPVLGIVLLAVLLFGFVDDSREQGALLTRTVNDQLTALTEHSRDFVHLSERHAALYALLSDPALRDEEDLYIQAKRQLDLIWRTIAELRKSITASVATMADNDEVTRLLEQLLDQTERYRLTMSSAVEAKMIRGRVEPGLIVQSNDLFVGLNHSYVALLNLRQNELHREIGSAVSQSMATNVRLSVKIIMASLLVLLLSIVLARWLSHALNEQLLRLFQLGSQGGLGADIHPGNEIEQISRAIEHFRNTQTSLHESEQRFRGFFEHNRSAMLQIDADSGAIIDANASAEQFYGYPAGALCKMNMSRIADAEWRQGATLQVHRRTGRDMRTVEFHATPLQVHGQTLLFSIVHDVTDRERAKNELRELNLTLEQRIVERTRALEDEKSLLRGLIDTIPDAISVKDTRGTYLMCNRSLYLSVGLEAEANVVARRSGDILDGETFRLIAENEAAVMASGEMRRFEMSLPGPDGKPLLFETIKAPLRDRDGRIIGTIGVAHDITERHEREIALRESRAAADAANLAKSVFLATMSHEIRTPMNGVIGMIDVLAHSRLNDYQADMVRTIHDSAFALLRIIDDILDFSKIEADRLDLEHAPVSLADLVEGIADSLVTVALDKQVDLFLFVSPELPGRIWGDSTRLRQILYNLLGNAIKFSGNRPALRGRVDFRVERDSFSEQHLSFSIRDNGIGINKEALDKLFVLFVQGESSITRRFGGTGLGLVISRRLAGLMGGDISVSSEVGKGSCFTLRLPVEPLDEDTTTSRRPPLAELHCIIMRDSAYIAEDLAVYLDHAGATSHVAENLSEAISLIAANPSAVLVHGELRHTAQASDIDALTYNRIMITRGHRRSARVGDNGRSMSLDISALRRASLIQAVGMAAGRIEARTPEEPQLSPPHFPEVRPVSDSPLLLVAEDDEINRKVIGKQLELLGYRYEMAVNGTEALNLWEKGDYAMLITDLHMPEMDGYRLASTIRAAGDGKSRRPLLALSANALRGEEEAALARGIDAYLTKPLQLHLLQKAIQEHLIAPEQAEDACYFNPAMLVEMIGDDPEMNREFLKEYLASARMHAANLLAAHEQFDLDRMEGIAHKFRSSSLSVGAQSLGELCAALEDAARARLQDDVTAGMVRFEQVLSATLKEIESFTVLNYQPKLN